MIATKLNNKFLTFLRENSTIILCVICFLASNLYLVSYLYPTNCPIKGDDYEYHYLRVEALKYNIENHNLFSGIDYLYFGGGGYAGFAYPELFLFIPALLRIAGMGIGESMAVFLSLCNVFSYCFMFIFLRSVSKSPVCATIGAVLYILSAYRIDNIITRFALGEILAYVFWPLILYGLYDFIFDDFKKPYIIGFGFVGMLLSHSISTALALILSFVVSIIFIKRITSSRGKLPKLFITAGCAVLVTAFYWLPLLELLFSCDMSVKSSPFHTVNHTIPFADLFKDSVNNGISGMKFPIFLLCVPRIFLTRNSPVSRQYLYDESTEKRRNILVAADVFMILGLVFAVLSTSLIPWRVLSFFFDFMQFPWRFFAPASVLLITAGAIYVFYIAEFTKVSKTAMVLITAVSVLMAYVQEDISEVNHTEQPYETDYYNDVGNTCTVGNGEWLPLAAKDDGINAVRAMGDTVLLGGEKTLPCERENGTLSFELHESVDFAELPYIWYKGYHAKDESGKELQISMSGRGLVQVDLHNASGKITVEHRPTLLRIVSCFISASAVIILIILTINANRAAQLRGSSVGQPPAKVLFKL